MHRSQCYLYSSSDDQSVFVWDLKTGKIIQEVECHEHFVMGVALHRRYPWVATIGCDGLTKLW